MVIARLRFKPLKSEKTAPSSSGSMAIVVAFGLVTLCSFLAFLLNTGLLYGNRNLYQNAAEAAAMAGAIRLCDEDTIDVARQIAIENGAPQGSVTVTLGFYDVESEHFFAEGSDNYPDDEYNNAVMVRIQTTENTILGGFLGKDKAQVGASAVAYLERYGIMSLKENGEVKLNCSSLEHGDVYAQGDIKFPQNQVPELSETSLLAHGEVLECPVTSSWWGGTTIHWDNGSPTHMDYTYSGVPEMGAIRPADDEYLEELKEKADLIYTPEDAGNDEIFYGMLANSIFGAPSYFLDLTNIPDQRLTIFFDCANQGTHPAAVIRPSSSAPWPSHSPSGCRIANITFVANCDVFIDEGDPVSGAYYLHLGDEGTRQAIIISSGNIKVYYGNIWFDGVTLRSGGDIELPPSHGDTYWANAMSSFRNKARLIADGDVFINYPTAHFNFTFGPPCPPSIVKLGKF